MTFSSVENPLLQKVIYCVSPVGRATKRLWMGVEK